MKKKKVINFGLFIVAFILFCNPNIRLIDLLPDCIGCLLIAWGISKLADLCDDLAEAKRAFYTLFWITLSKGPALILLLAIVGSNQNEATMWLLFAFCYAVAEVVFGIRAFSLLFDGLAYLGERNDGGDFIFAVPQRQKKPRKDGTPRPVRTLRLESIARTTSVFIIIKAACCTLPEFVYIYPQDEINNSGYDILRFSPLFIAFGVIVAAVAGIVWLVKMCRYVAHLAKHKEFWQSMRARYETEVLPKQGIFVMRYTRVFAIVVTVALIFSVNLYIDEYSILPDFVAAALFFAAACVIGKYVGGSKALKVSSALYFVTAAVTFVAMLVFKTDGFTDFGYYYRNVNANDDAARLYAVYAVSNAVMNVAFFATMLSLASLMMRIVRAHTGLNTITGVSNSSRPLQKVYASRLNRMRALSLVSAVVGVLYFYFAIFYEREAIRNGGYRYGPQFEVVWMVDFIVSAAFALHAANIANDISAEVNYKYKYE